MKWGLVLLMLVVPLVSATTIHGTVYDIGLNVLSDVIVDINSTPEQVIVVKNGTYAFSVPPGSYVLHAGQQKLDLEVWENISTAQSGDYVVDLILLPSLAQDEGVLTQERDQADVPAVDDLIDELPVSTPWLLWVLLFVGLGYVIVKVSRAPKVKREIVQKEVVKEVAVSEEIEKVIAFVDKQGGRTTQKEIRGQFPYSEAKVSLMLDELESKGLIKRIKKGRGNVIIRA